MIPANSRFADIPSRFDIFQIFFLEMIQVLLMCLHGTNVTYFTPQNMFLEDI